MQGITNALKKQKTQQKTINITANGSKTVTPDDEETLLSSVGINVNVPWKGSLTPVFGSWSFTISSGTRLASSATLTGLTPGENYFAIIGHHAAYRTLATASVTGISGGTLISWKTGSTGSEINGIVVVFTANSSSVTISLSGGSSNTNWNQGNTGFTIRV